MSHPDTPPYAWGQTVTLPARFATVAGITETARIQFVDEIDRYVRVTVAGYTQVVSFEEPDAATEQVTA
jgi:hypothetical protein